MFSPSFPQFISTVVISSYFLHFFAESMFVECNPSSQTYHLNPEELVPVQIACHYGGNPLPKIIIPPNFNSYRNDSHVILKATGDAVKLNGTHCVTATLNNTDLVAPTVQSCFDINVKRESMSVRGARTPSNKEKCKFCEFLVVRFEHQND